MRRSAVVLASVNIAIGMVLVSAVPTAAQAPKIPRIGFLSVQDSTVLQFADGMREGLRGLGWVEGRNIQIEYRWAQGRFERLPELAAELVDLKPDVIIAVVTAASLAAKAATRTIPIVMVGVGDPVSVGLVASLARPGGNITGTAAMSADLVGKQLELLTDLDPNVSRVAVLWNPTNAVFQALQVREAEAAGRSAGVQLQFFEARKPEEFDTALAAVRREGARALLVLSDPLFVLHRQALVEGIVKNRLAAVSGFYEFVQAGGLMAYGPSYFHTSKRAATYVDKILKGAKPADLPIEQPTRFELVVNLKTAIALGIAIPPAILARAEEVIE